MTDALASESTGACFFFDQQGIVHYESAPEDQTINQDFYLVVLRHLRDVVQRK
jgi:hypothetical protein